MSDLRKYVSARKQRDPAFAEDYEAGYRRFRDAEKAPRVVSAKAIGNTELLILFDNGFEKTYDVAPLLAKPPFHLLNTPAFFKTVRVDAGGHGVSWSEEVDLSECELWNNGKELLNSS